MKSIIKNALILMTITLTAGVSLGAVHAITEEPIAAQEKKKKEDACKAVFPEAETFEAWEEFDEEKAEELLTLAGFTADKVEDVTLAEDEKGELLGAVLNVTSTEGYGGDISFSLGILKDGTVSGIQILSISETAGLGMRAKEESFYGQFAGKNAEKFSYTKTGASSEDEIDAISGATITTRAMTNGVNAGLSYFSDSLVKGGMIHE